MLLTSFSSGSTGNCSLVSTKTENILIDCGISAKKIRAFMGELDKKEEKIDAILLTHEHIDHVKGLKRMLQTEKIPVYCSEGTWNGLADSTKDEFFRFAGREYFHPVSPDCEFYIGNTLIRPFHTWHDTAGPLGYRFETEEQICGIDLNLAVLTDCGIYDDYICSYLKDLDALIIEANHDVEMLMNGPYPMHLKRRILSQRGHSSNVSCGETLAKIWTPRLKEVLLAHLSEDNNTPEAAVCCVRGILSKEETYVSAAPKNGLSRVIRF